MLTVVCWKWGGWRSYYRSYHVKTLQKMVRRHLRIPHRFVCVTDDPRGLECDTVDLRELASSVMADDVRCYSKLSMFSKAAVKLLGEKILSLDLDCVILNDITSLVTNDDLKVMWAKVCPYNNSIVLHKTGTRTFVWNEFDPEKSPELIKQHWERTGVPHVGSDQAWLAYRSPGAPTWREPDGVFQYTWLGPGVIPAKARIVFFAGPKKPWSSEVQRDHPRLHDTYMEALSC